MKINIDDCIRFSDGKKFESMLRKAKKSGQIIKKRKRCRLGLFRVAGFT